MNLVLALEPDPSQAAPLTSVVRRKLGANLTVVATSQAAIVAMNHRMPDVLLFGSGVPQTERDQASAHLTSLSGGSEVRVLDIPRLTSASVEDLVAFDIRMCLAAAEQERVRAMATVLATDRDENEWAPWNDGQAATPAAPVLSVPAVDESRVHEEIDSRIKTEIERLRRAADEPLPIEIRLPRADARASTPVSAQQEPKSSRKQRWTATFPWRVLAAVALVLIVVAIGAIWLPHAVLSTAARNSSSFVGNAQKAATAAAEQAVAAAPAVTRRAITAAEQVIPRPEFMKPGSTPAPKTRSDAGTTPEPITGSGFITAFSRIPMDVYADGKRIGSTEDGQLLLASGAHQVEFVSERFHYRAIAGLTIAPGHVLAYTVPLPSAELRVNTTPGAEVWIEGERVGVAPLEPMQVPIGTREVIVRDSTGGEKRQAVEVKFGETVEVSLTPEPATGDTPPAAPRLAPLSR